MSFNVGDRVRTVSDNERLNGHVGTVVDVRNPEDITEEERAFERFLWTVLSGEQYPEEADNWNVAVKFDVPAEGFPSGNFAEHELELLA